MKLTSTCNAALLLVLASLIASTESIAQISLVCTNPSTMIYGLGSNGEIREVNINTAATGAVVKNTTYSGSSPSSANGLGYNRTNGMFYYFKRNVTSSPQQFVSFNPLLNIVTPLANSTCSADIHVGCVNYTGTGYYTIDVNGRLHYYNILTNSWTQITSTMIDQNGNDVDAVIRTQTAGDMAVDGWGHIWLITANSTNYALYRIGAPLPTTPVASLTVTRVIAPTTPTPAGQSFAGIAFNPTGQIYISTKDGNRLYRLNNNYSLTFIGTLTTNDIGNDLTSCNFPSLVLPVSWKSFDVSLRNDNKVKLDWEIAEQDNTGFYIEHSLDGSNWQELTFIKSKGTHESMMQVYSWLHNNPFSGVQYYRIRQVDNNGKESYSDVRTITIKGNKATITVWPNPATDQLRIINQGTHSSRAQLFDLSGRIILTKQLQPSVVNTINISTLPVGTYIIKIENSDGSVYNQKVNKQ